MYTHATRSSVKLAVICTVAVQTRSCMQLINHEHYYWLAFCGHVVCNHGLWSGACIVHMYRRTCMSLHCLLCVCAYTYSCLRALAYGGPEGQSSPTKHQASRVSRHLPNISPHLPNVRLHVSVLMYNIRLQLSVITSHVSISIFTYHVSHPLHIRSLLVSHAQNTQFHQSYGCMKTCDFNSRQRFTYIPLTLCVQRPHTLKCYGCV